MSASNLFLLHMLSAVCLSMGPTDLRDMTIPSTRGVARVILEIIYSEILFMKVEC